MFLSLCLSKRFTANNMNHQEPRNFSTTCGDNYETGQSSRNNIEDAYHFPDSGVSQPMNPWLQISCSLDNISTTQLVDQGFQDTFGVLMEMDHLAQTSSSMQADTSNIASKSEFSSEPDKGKSTGTKEIPDHEIVHQKCQSNDMIETSEELSRSRQNDRGKRKRSATVHSFSERRRRDRINQRMKTLQELIPNCNKADKVSVLDDAINYLKALKLQVDMMTSGGGVIFQDRSGIQSRQVSQFCPFVLPMMPNFSWDMCYSTGFNHPMIPVQSLCLHPSQLLAGGIGMAPVSNPGNHMVPQLQMPFNHSQQLPSSIDTSTLPKQFVSGESASQAIPCTHHTASNHHQ